MYETALFAGLVALCIAEIVWALHRVANLPEVLERWLKL